MVFRKHNNKTMTVEEFKDWLDDLDLQTLTDELKETILEKVTDVSIKSQEDGWYEGFDEAKEKLQAFIDNEMDY